MVRELSKVQAAPDLDQLISDLVTKYQPERVILFGSRARGDAVQTSDIDLLVVKETDQRFVERIAEVFRLIRPKVALDVLVYTPAEFARLKESNPFVRHAVGEGRELYRAGQDVPVKEQPVNRVPGGAKGKITTAPDFDGPLPDAVQELFEK